MKTFHVLSLGAGVQSTTLYLMFAKGLLTPQMDCAIFADTGEVDAALRIPGRVVNRRTDQSLYVHRSCVPLVQVELKPKNEREMQLGMGFQPECLGVCGV